MIERGIIPVCFFISFISKESRNIVPEDPAKDIHFKEPDIDNMRAQKKKVSFTSIFIVWKQNAFT